MARLTGLLLVCLTACGNIARKNDDAGVRDDGRMIDGSMMTDGSIADASADATVLAPTESREITPGGVRMTGSTYTFEVQLGHGTEQKQAVGSTYTLEGNAAVKQ